MPEDELYTLIDEYYQLDNPDHQGGKRLLGMFNSFFGVHIESRRYSKHKTEVIRNILNRKDVRSVGFLLDRLYKNQPSTPKVEIRQALADLLPHLKHGQPPLLNAGQLSTLYLQLADKDENVLMAVLQAIEEVGECNALPYITVLLQRGKPVVRSVAVRQKAQACQKMLGERLQRLNQPQTLLRASEAPTTAHEELVRPASATNETPAEQLLRVSAEVEAPR